MSDERTVKRMQTDLLVSERKLTIACACHGAVGMKRCTNEKSGKLAASARGTRLHTAEKDAGEQHGVRAHALRRRDARVLAHLGRTASRGDF